MIRKATNKPDWFLLDREDAKPLFGLPGLGVQGDRFVAPRNMLSLLQSPEAQALLQREGSSSKIWEARDAQTAKLGFKLRTTQHQAIDFALPRRGVLIGDDPRVGKTVSALMSHHPARGRMMVVAPLSTRGVWMGWIRRIFPGADIGVFTKRKYDPVRAQKPFVFAHYDVLPHWQNMNPLGTLILDEAHMLGNPSTKRSVAASLLATCAEKVVALTGTPIWNVPANLWMLISLLAPKAWGDYYGFCNRYGDPKPTAYGTEYRGLSNEAELKARLSEVMIRRRWIDVADDIPPITRSVIVADLEDSTRNRLDILAAALQTERSNTAANLAAYRQRLSGIKAKIVVGEAEKILGRNEPVVVWTWHKVAAEEIAQTLGTRAFLITGDVPPDERERRIEAWKAQPAAALVATMAVAQVGIDLSHARIALFGEIDYTPAVIGQAEMRTFSPTRGMDVIFVVANHYADQRIVRALIHKLSAADPLGVGAAVDAIDALREAVMGPKDDGDLDRLLADLLASA